ncbi:hypothetical protein, partial [Burkholderia sp. 3C]
YEEHFEARQLLFSALRSTDCIDRVPHQFKEAASIPALSLSCLASPPVLRFRHRERGRILSTHPASCKRFRKENA